jgi:hypothetical protein
VSTTVRRRKKTRSYRSDWHREPFETFHAHLVPDVTTGTVRDRVESLVRHVAYSSERRQGLARDIIGSRHHFGKPVR